jgi:hypothetical protein
LQSDIDRVRVVVSRPAEVIVDEFLDVDPGQGTATMDVEVELLAKTEELLVRVELWVGEISALGGEVSMVADASKPINESPVINLGPIAPVLDLLGGALRLVGPTGSGIVARPFVVRNVGGGTLEWSGSADQSWLAVSPPLGSLPAGASSTVTATASLEGLEPATYSASITLVDPNALESPQTLPVTLTVTPSTDPLRPETRTARWWSGAGTSATEERRRRRTRRTRMRRQAATR